MDELLRQIRLATDAGFYYLALAGALTVPDICGAMAEPDGRATGDRYTRWFDRYVAPRYVVGPNRQPTLTGTGCWGFRCAFLHQGRLRHPKMGFSRILFLEPRDGNVILHNNVLNDALNIDVRVFCSDIVEGAFAWQRDVDGSPVVEKNRQLFVQRYDSGLAPYIAGLPVIA